jgi:hypothetical protein
MARLAATDFQADWVINSNADEFWWPRGADLKEVLKSLPPRYGVVGAFCRAFVPRPDESAFFAERMAVRLSPEAAVDNPSGQFRPSFEIIHRAHPGVTVRRGSHAVGDVFLQPLRGWYPVELLQFPLRSEDDDGYRRLVVDDDALERGLDEGSLVLDTRLRDALRVLTGAEDRPLPAADARFALPGQDSPRLRFPRPSVVEDAAYAVEAAVLGEADSVRLQRRLDELERRLALLERSPWRRLGRRSRRVIARLRPPSDAR